MGAPLILALDTAAEVCSVALWSGAGGDNDAGADAAGAGHLLCTRQSSGADGRASGRVLELIAAVGDECEVALADLDAIAFNCGPGSFTGVRVGEGVARGIALGCALPVIPISALAALAYTATAEWVLAALDARLGQVHLGCYRRQANGDCRAHIPEMLCNPSEATIDRDRPWVGIGNGWQRAHKELQTALGREVPWTSAEGDTEAAATITALATLAALRRHDYCAATAAQERG